MHATPELQEALDRLTGDQLAGFLAAAIKHSEETLETDPSNRLTHVRLTCESRTEAGRTMALAIYFGARPEGDEGDEDDEGDTE